ncbi:hypothetical protein DAPPUDRAFT_117305 [Daphnia pulex]|uniref:Uncharacterized protein n=1 Tax=Daphnia pulex TaxID=6669 RepID=E9HS86_DAPPU|nr:hypothetical protein DAPPUDRAFT_117305 [Daphnia pulex]|eukprot:EFX65393.1 hypothetical protein DAPPUDRAFT_117305 [Daphnia pulex]
MASNREIQWKGKEVTWFSDQSRPMKRNTTECRAFIGGCQGCGDCTITAECGAIRDVVASLQLGWCNREMHQDIELHDSIVLSSGSLQLLRVKLVLVVQVQAVSIVLSYQLATVLGGDGDRISPWKSLRRSGFRLRVGGGSGEYGGVTRGLLDLTDPEYCFKLHNAKEDGYKSMSKPVNYKVVTTMDTVLKLQGLVCSQWIETKRITGSFWIGSYDTEHFHATKAVDPKECWDMKLQLNCAGNRNVVNGKTYSYIQKPNGQGKWISITEYSVVNFLAQDIELRQEDKDGPILSPFGAHNVSLEAEKLFINHNTLAWHKSNQGYSANNCKPCDDTQENTILEDL